MTDRSIQEVEEMGGARYTPEERQDYEDSLKVYRDLKNVLDTAELKGMKKGLQQGRQEGLQQGRQEGIEQGRQEGIEKGIAQGALDEKRKNAKTMKSLGLPLETIAKVTGLSAADIAEL